MSTVINLGPVTLASGEEPGLARDVGPKDNEETGKRARRAFRHAGLAGCWCEKPLNRGNVGRGHST